MSDPNLTAPSATAPAAAGSEPTQSAAPPATPERIPQLEWMKAGMVSAVPAPTPVAPTASMPATVPELAAVTPPVQAAPADPAAPEVPTLPGEPAVPGDPDVPKDPAVPSSASPVAENREQLHRRVESRLAELEAARAQLANQDGNKGRAVALDNELQLARNAMSGGWANVGPVQAAQLSAWLTNTQNLILAQPAAPVPNQ